MERGKISQGEKKKAKRKIHSLLEIAIETARPRYFLFLFCCFLYFLILCKGKSFKFVFGHFYAVSLFVVHTFD